MKERFSKHLNKLFSAYQKNDKIADFQEELLGTLMERFNELKSSGMSEDESYNKSLLILDGIKDTIKTLETAEAPQSLEKKIGNLLLPALAYWCALLIIYLAVSFGTGLWDKSWMVIVGGALLFGLIVCGVFFRITKEKGMQLLSRANLLCAIMCLAAAIYLGWSYYSNLWTYSWIIFIVALLIWFVIDLALRMSENKGKYKITALDAIIITVLITLVIYVLVSFISNLWATSWIIFIVMALIILIELMIFNSKNK